MKSYASGGSLLVSKLATRLDILILTLSWVVWDAAR